MLPTLPLDVDGKQIRIGNKVIFGADNGSYLHVGIVINITPCFVWMKLEHDPSKCNHTYRRDFRRVAIIE